MPFIILTCKHCGNEFFATRPRKYCFNGCSRKMGRRNSRQAHASRSAERKRAMAVVGAAFEHGRLVRQPCEVCGTTTWPVDAHHDDYTKPLDVRWLCRSHHKLHHDALRKAGVAVIGA